MKRIRRAPRAIGRAVVARQLDLFVFLGLAFVNVGAWLHSYVVGCFVTGPSFLLLALLAEGNDRVDGPTQPGQQPPRE